jgi:hypothetical protein
MPCTMCHRLVRARVLCLGNARQLGVHDATVWGLDWAEKETNAVIPSGGPHHHGVMQCDRVHMVCFHDQQSFRYVSVLGDFRP